MQDIERAGILYYARERQYRHIHTSALKLTQRHGSQPELVFWKAYSLVMEERESEGMREVEAVQQESKELSLAAKLLLVYAHKKCKIVDREAVQQLESTIRSERTGSSERALYHAALFLWLSGRSDKSREYCDRLLKLAPGSELGLPLRGWIDLTSGRDAVVKKSIKYFEEAATLHSQQSPGSPTPVDVLLGKCCYYYQRHNFSHSLELASQAVAAHPRFLPPLVEKMRIQLALQDWDQAAETAQRCLSQDASCVEAHRVLVLELLARRGDHTETVTALGDLMTQLDQCEPRTHWIYHDTALGPARLAGGNPQVLQQTIALVERAISLSPHSAVYLNELAYQQLLCGKVAESLASYKKAFSVDETSVEALAGVIHCQLLSEHSHEAQQQLEFLAEVQSSIGKQANVLYLNVLLGQQRSRAESEVLPLILEARDLHIRGLKGQPLSCRYFELYNPQFLLWIAQCLVEYAPTEPALTPAQAHPTLPQAAAILESILTAAPALTPALLLLARVKYLSGEMQGSQSCLQRCLRLDSSSTEAHLLVAQIQLHSNNPQQSQSSLEMALSHSFEVKTHPLFQLISGRVQRALGHAPEALASLQAALTMSRAQPSQSLRGVVGVAGGGRVGLGPSERATVYLEMVDVLTKLGRQHEAAKTMQDAIHEFSGTSEEFRISIANADLSLERGDSEGALAMLKTVTDDKPYFLRAKQKMADIYLNHRKDRRMYISCFRDLAEKVPGPSTALLLGDAFMNIQEPEEALSVYEKALKRSSRDSVLASKVGQALVKTHQYTKAISYYEAALKSEGLQFLRADLSGLYLRLNHFDRAEKTIHTALSQREGSTDVGAMCGSVELLQLLAGVREKAGRESEARQALEQARETQAKVLKKASVDQPDSLPRHKRKAADILSQLAKACTDNQDWVTGLQYCREALLHCEADLTARLALSEALLASGEQEESLEECSTVLRADPQHREACMLMAELMFRKANYEKAVEHYQNLLSKTPDYFPALAKLVEVGKRWGKLNSTAPYVDQAASVCSRPDSSPGLNYCRGLLARYQGNTGEALRLLNKARRDTEWSHRALVCMVDICVNPDCDVIGGETFRGTNSTEREGSSQREEQSTALATAQKLLKEARPKTAEEEVKVHMLEGWVLLATRSKVDAEQALSRFMEIATSSNDNVGALVGVATGHMILKQTPRARNQLKRIAKTPWTSQEAESFERGWLLLADVYVQTGKYDMAIELLKKCLQYNQSCSRAWEYMGFISEKEQAYKDAAASYEKAWRYSNRSNPAIGYRLAFNYLKAKRLVEAIDVCHTVLEKHPHYPRIQRDIMDKARQGIRV